MKKLLLTGTALAGLALIIAPAKADVKMSASFGTGFTVASSDDANADDATNVQQFYTDAEVAAQAEKDIAIGKAGVKVEFKANADGFNDGGEIDESSVYLSGGWGRVEVGSFDGAEDSKISGYSDNIDGMTDNNNTYTGADHNIIGYDATLSSGNADTSDAAKIMYTTPSFGGVSASVSYTPDTSTVTADTTVDAQYGFNVGYEGKAGAADVAVKATYGHADLNIAGASGDASVWNLGGSVGMNGFKVLAGYGVSKADTATAGQEDENRNLSLGANYTMGMTMVLASWTRNNGDYAVDADTTEWALGVNYTLGEGVAVRSGYTNGSYDETGASGVDYQVFDVGLDLSF